MIRRNIADCRYTRNIVNYWRSNIDCIKGKSGPWSDLETGDSAPFLKSFHLYRPKSILPKAHREVRIYIVLANMLSFVNQSERSPRLFELKPLTDRFCVGKVGPSPACIRDNFGLQC